MPCARRHPASPARRNWSPKAPPRVALLGKQEATQRSQGESLLVARAGGGKADPLIRYVVDDQFGDIAHKDKSFADRVMFWRKEPPAPVSQAKIAGETSTPIDPVAEQAKIKSPDRRQAGDHRPRAGKKGLQTSRPLG